MNYCNAKIRMFKHGFSTVLLSFLLISCDYLNLSPKPAPIHAKKHAHVHTTKIAKADKVDKAGKSDKKQPSYTASTFIEHLSLARIALAQDEDITTIQADIDALNGYLQQKSAKNEVQTVVLFEYKTDGKNLPLTIIAPIDDTGKSNFAELLEITSTINNKTAMLNNMHIARVSMSPHPETIIPNNDASELESALDSQQHNLLDSAEKLPLIADIEVQMKLIQFFIDHQCQDAAYIAVDNAKLALASAPKSDGDDRLEALSKQLESLESQLHSSLPYTL